jgi:hypothetical protein
MTDAYTAALLRAIQARSRVKFLQGTFVSASIGGALVDIGGQRIPALLGTLFLPEVNEPVQVWNIDKQYFVMGPVATKPDRGTVVSVSGGLATLTPNIGTNPVVAPYTGTTPSAGQTMKLLWHGGPLAMLMSTSPAGNTPPTAPGGAATTHTDYFTAIDAGSYGSGRWWTSQVYASDNNLGAWFYGSKISDTIPASAAIQSVELFLSPTSQNSGANPNVALHSYQSKPGGSPSLSSATAIGVVPGFVVIDGPGFSTGFGNALRAGGGAAGVGLSHGGFHIFNSLAADGQSGTLRIISSY